METVLNQTGEKKNAKWPFLQGNLQKQAGFFIKACKRSLSSFFLHAFVFSDSNSTENVPKTIYTAKIVGYR